MVPNGVTICSKWYRMAPSGFVICLVDKICHSKVSDYGFRLFCLFDGLGLILEKVSAVGGE